MKRIISLLLAVMMLFALTACGKKAETAEPAGSEAAESAPEVVVNTTILKEEDDNMINNYSLLAVNPEAPFADADGNEAGLKWEWALRLCLGLKTRQRPLAG